MENSGAIAFLAALFFGVPILISRLLLGASWRAIARAYAIWFGFLSIIGVLASSNSWDEGFGAAIITGMFLTIPAVPIVILVLKLASILLKLIRRIQNS